MRKSLYLLIALVCGTLATVSANQWLKAQANTQVTSTTTEIFVATSAIDIGQKITPERIRLEQWPADRIPDGATGDFEVLKGKYAQQRFYVGEAIMPVKLMDENWTAVPKGYQVVALPANNVGIANLIQPGDRVDVHAYFSKSELAPQSMNKTVLMGVRVYALDGDTERRAGEDRAKNPRNIQLLIHEKDVDAWQYARELGKVGLSLGSDADYSADDGSNQAAAEFLAWLDEHRAAQEQAEQEKLRQREPQPVAAAAVTPTVETPKPKEDGFSMIKMVEGRMIEYWIVPGKLPVLVGEVGGKDGAASETKTNTTSETSDTEAEDYSYLNGDESPFFQPPAPGESSMFTN